MVNDEAKVIFVSLSCPTELLPGPSKESLVQRELPGVTVKVFTEQAAAQPSAEYLGGASGVFCFNLVAEKQRRNSGVGA